jgi:hypothetical protein
MATIVQPNKYNLARLLDWSHKPNSSQRQATVTGSNTASKLLKLVGSMLKHNLADIPVAPRTEGINTATIHYYRLHSAAGHYATAEAKHRLNQVARAAPQGPQHPAEEGVGKATV